MRLAVVGLLGLLLAGCVGPTTNGEILHREVGRSIADVTLVAGPPGSSFDTTEGLRGFRWDRPHLSPTGGRRCRYTLYALREGNSNNLAAWRVVGSEVPEAGCGPLVRVGPQA